MIKSLCCEYKTNPIGIDVENPRLSWKISSNERNVLQKKFHIQVCKETDDFECRDSLLLDTGKIESDDIFYFVDNFDIEPETNYFWRVKLSLLINGNTKETGWSETAKFITGLGKNNWLAKWIGSLEKEEVSLFRKQFSLNKKVNQAVLYGTALGVYDLQLNGERVCEDVLAPGWTDYKKRIYYRAFDVTENLINGENIVGGSVAPGWYAGYIGPLKERCYYGDKTFFSSILKIKYEDGSEEAIETDETWLTRKDSTTCADLIVGEEYDAEKEAGNYTAANFVVNEEWKGAIALSDSSVLPKEIESYPGFIPKPIKEFTAEKISKYKDSFIIDFGQNMTGFARLKLENPKCGQKISLKYIEAVNDDGSPYTENLRDARVTDIYTAKGASEETWQAKYTLHGFRYIIVDGLKNEPKTDTVTAIAVSSIYEQEGSFECGNSKVNQLCSNIYWGFIDNYVDVPTDCPQRDERLGWTGDTQVFIRTASYMATIAPFMKKWLVDVVDQQNQNGAFHEVAPAIGSGRDGRAAWADAGIICPYELWKAYNDQEFILDYWDNMTRFMRFIYSEGNSHNGEEPITYGDWLNLEKGPETPHRIIGLAYRVYDSRLMAEMAEAVNKTEDAEFYRKNEKSSLEMFKKEFFNSDGSLKCLTQTACALAIWMELLDGDELKRTADILVENLTGNNGYLTTGFVGSRHICPALTKIGRHDLAVQLLLNEGIPSWLYAVNAGATTIWERWNGWEYNIKYGVKQEAKFGSDPLNSLNHYAYGAVGEWMFRDLAGIKSTVPGYKEIKIEPKPAKRLGYAKARFTSIYGEVKSEWKYEDNKIKFEVEIPAGAKAEVILPNGESHKIGSGDYNFEIQNN